MTAANFFDQKLLGPTVYVPKRLIKLVGRTPAALLQQLHYSLLNSEFTQYGDRWVSRTLDTWADILECSSKTIQRAFERLEELGLVLSSRFHTHAYCQRKSYRVDYDRLESFLESETKRLDQPRQSVFIDVDTLSSSNNKSLKTALKEQQTVFEEPHKLESNPTHHPVKRIDKGGSVAQIQSSGEDSSNKFLDSPKQSQSKTDELDKELEKEVIKTLGHKINQDFRTLLSNNPIEVIQDALNVLRGGKNIKNKAGFLRRAIENKWHPSSTVNSEKKFNLDPDFDEWWGYAKQLGLVMGSQLEGDQFLIYAAPGGEPIPYAEIRSMFSMNWLKKRLQQA